MLQKIQCKKMSVASFTSRWKKIVFLLALFALLFSGSIPNVALVNALIDPVSLVATKAPLLGGRVRECAEIGCFHGGVAAVQALVRFYNDGGDDEEVDPNKNTLVIPFGDFKTPLTTYSRFLFGVNVMIFSNALKWRTWAIPSYAAGMPGRFEQKALEDAQQPDFPALMSNVIISPGDQTFFGHVKHLHLDEPTGMGVIYVGRDKRDWEAPSPEAVFSLVKYIHKRNADNGCISRQEPSPLRVFQDISFSEWYNQSSSPLTEPTPEVHRNTNERCYFPVVVWCDWRLNHNNGDDFFVELENADPMEQPLLLLDTSGHFLEEGELYKVFPPTSHSKMWVVSQKYQGNPVAVDTKSFFRINMEFTDESVGDELEIKNVTVIYNDLLDIPDEAKTDEYYRDSENINMYAREAYETSLVKEQGALSEEMPASVLEDGYKRCLVGECEMGNLAADAFRSMGGADVAFVPDILLEEGPGWVRGEVRFLELMENFPLIGQRCAGVTTGLSIHRLLNSGVQASTHDGYTDQRNHGLHHVSGLRYSFNSELANADDAILSIQVWNETLQSYGPLELTRLYTFASTSHLCLSPIGEYRQYVDSLLTADGEVPGYKATDRSYIDEIKEYLLDKFSNETYVPKLEGRITNDKTNFNALKLIDQSDCVELKEHWNTTVLECQPCPTHRNDSFSKVGSYMKGEVLIDEKLFDKVVFANNEPYPVEFTAELLALPDYVSLSISSDGVLETNHTYYLAPGEQLSIDITYDASGKEAGVDTTSLMFLVHDANVTIGCQSLTMFFPIVAELAQQSEANNLEGVASFGYSSAALIIISSLCLLGWVQKNRQARVVSEMQPFFLSALLIGILIIGSSLIPLSVDDAVASNRGCDMACMAFSWLIFIGFEITLAALFSKLLRINKVLNEDLRRVEVKEKDVVLPSIITSCFVFIFLLVWTLVDPITWERLRREDQPWNTYGKCVVGGGVGRAMMTSTIVVVAIMLLATGWQAFKARKISSEYSESTYLGIAVFSWLQLAVVGIPVFFLVEEHNVVAKYSIVVGMLLVVCMSMMLLIFVPILHFKYKNERLPKVRISGVDFTSDELHGPGLASSFNIGIATDGQNHERSSVFAATDSSTKLQELSKRGFGTPENPEGSISEP